MHGSQLSIGHLKTQQVFACSSLVLYGINAPIIGPSRATCMEATYLLCHKEPARSKQRPVGGFECPIWFFMAYESWRSNTMKLSTNESRASTFLDQWEWTRLAEAEQNWCGHHNKAEHCITVESSCSRCSPVSAGRDWSIEAGARPGQKVQFCIIFKILELLDPPSIIQRSTLL